VDELGGFGWADNSSELGCSYVQQLIQLAMGFVCTNKTQNK
jgi:hypothetical protein